MAKRANKISAPATLDLGYMKAATILTKQPPPESPITIYLVGCGGTGSYLALHIGRLLRALADRGQLARGVFVDHDRVEPKNLGRQLFCDAELNLNKASALAFRYGTAWGVEITAIAKRFTASMVNPETDRRTARYETTALDVIVGCVDNAAARKEISFALKRNKKVGPPSVWWIDCGNHAEAGQVLLGSAPRGYWLPQNAFPSKEICQSLPSPALQRPDLLVARREETDARKMSCAELTAANLQSLNINSRIASEASDFLTRLLLTRDLKRFACELNLAAGSMRSFYATSEALEGFAN